MPAGVGRMRRRTKGNSMKTEMMVAAALAICLSATGRAGEATLNRAEGEGARNHAVYIGLGYGPTQLKTSGKEREVSGIDFTFDTEANDLGSAFYLGGWITDHVGLEVGARDFGTIEAPFAFRDPHDNTSGTGMSEVSVNGFNVSLMLGFDVLEDVQIVGRAGALTWKERYKSRFDIPGKPAINAEMEGSGTGPALGAGITYRFTPGWQLEARYEYASLDEDTVSLLTVGLSYDFIGLVRD